jgi:DNA-binding response OmpR family regulator
VEVARVLLAEDDPALADLTVELLTSEGYEVTQVASADAALALVRVARWDVCLVDTFSPGFSAIHEDERTFLAAMSSFAPVIVFTARTWAYHTSAADLGVRAIVTKPFDVGRFLAVLRGVIWG